MPRAELFIWEVPGKPVVVHFPLNVIERLSAEIMRTYGANPKRSPEVGGLLLGTVIRPENGETNAEQRPPTIVRVDDFEPSRATTARSFLCVYRTKIPGPLRRRPRVRIGRLFSQPHARRAYAGARGSGPAEPSFRRSVLFRAAGEALRH